MTRVHFLNVGNGDCSIIQHDSRRVSMIDICKGNISDLEVKRGLYARLGSAMSIRQASTNHMKDYPTNPVRYCTERGINSIFRFILTHPDMDHMDGLKNFFGQIPFANFWHPGIKKQKPPFEGQQFLEEDWDFYQQLVDHKVDRVKVLSNLAGVTFEYANKGDIGGQGDCLHIVSPNEDIVKEASTSEQPNSASYVLVLDTEDGKIIFGGDSEDKSWDYILQKHSNLVKDCAVLIAPHHGRKQDSYKFLDVLKPRLTLFGNAPSEHLAYAAWSNRNLQYITNNQAGNVILEATSTGIDVYLENFAFASEYQSFDANRINIGCFYIGTVLKPEEPNLAKALEELGRSLKERGYGI